MRLHRIRLQNYRGVADCSVAFATDGVTIVEGDNEVGKTCIPEALDLILRLADSSKAKPLPDVRPVQRDAGPEVEVEITLGDYRFVYSKRWHRGPRTGLDITEPRREQLSGRQAHDRVREILDETLDNDLWKALCIEQGAEVTLPRFDVSSLGRALDAAAGGESTGGREDDLWERICDERAKYWTATGRWPTGRTDAERKVREARENVAALEERFARVEADTAEFQRRLANRERLEAQRQDARRHAEEVDEQWQRVEALRADVERLEARHNAAVERRDRIDGDVQRRAELVADVEDRTRDLAAREADVERAAPTLAAVTARATVAEQALEVARTVLGEARAAQLRANDDRDHHRRMIEVAQLDERRERVIEAQLALSAAEAHLESVRLDDELAGRIEQAHLAAVRAEAAAGSAAASLDVEALSDVILLIAGEEIALSAGSGRNISVANEMQLTVPGIVQVGVRAGGGSRDRAAERREAEAELKRLCESGDVGSLDEARRVAGLRKEAKRSRAEAIATIERDLRDLTLDVMVQKIEGLTERIDNYAAERPAEPPLPVDFEQAKQRASLADRTVADREADDAGCRHAAEQAREQLRQAELDGAVAAEKIDQARKARALAAETLEAARHERSDADLRAALAREQQAAEIAAEELAQARGAVTEADADSLGALVEKTQGTAERTAEALRANEEHLTELRISLQHRGEDGLHSQLNEARSRCRHAERVHERVESRAQAAELLYRTFEARRTESRRRYLAPFKERIEQFGRIVFGPTFEVELDDDLRVARRTLDGVTLDLEQLSVGAREQIGVLCRLACAVIVSPDGGGAPVVIDDALGWSDPSRLTRMGAAIAAAGRACQVIVLTCTPGRYAHVGNATVITLAN